MDCPRCHGNGELENGSGGSGGTHGNDEKFHGSGREQGAWPVICPTCEGSGYLEEAM